MKRLGVLGFCAALFLFMLVSSVYADEKSIVDKFIGSPLLILVAFLLIVGLAFVYHKIRK
jgi:hypothetical protein